MPQTYISNAFVSEALDCARRGDVDIGLLLDKTGITAPGGGHVTPEAFGQLWLGIAEAMNDEFFGNAARPMRPGSFALMGHAVRGAPNVEAGLRRALRFLRVAIDEPYGTLTVRSGIAEITLYDTQIDRSAFAYRTFWVILHGLTCWLARHRIPLHGLALTCAAPPHSSDYNRFFGAPVVFDAPRGILRFDASHLRRPAARSEAALKRFLRAAPGNFLTGYKYDEGIIGSIAAYLDGQDARDWPSLPELSTRFSMSPASLRRQLKIQGSSYRALKTQLRRERAFTLLKRTDSSVAEISELLGYAEPSAFFRAFHSWTGQSPAVWRNSTRDGT